MAPSLRSRKPQLDPQNSAVEEPAISPNSTPVHEMEGPSKVNKLLIRVGAALGMLVVLLGTIFYAGQRGVALMIVLVTCGLFREMVNVAHHEGNVDREMPWFRSILYAWFSTAMFTAYTLPSLQAPMRFSGSLRTALPVLGPLLALALEAEWLHPLVGLWLYAGTFVATVLSFRPHLLAQQLRTLSFTILALSLFVVPMKMAIHNAYVGLFWFLFPLMLVAVNDSFAYFSGLCFGRKFIRRPFLAISPNKTWEGFIGGGLATLVGGYYLPLLLNHPYLTCSFEAIELAAAEGLEHCTPAAIFLPPKDDGFLMVQWHGLALAAFASTVAPFGGFAASAIKRAYGIKDFANFIPGHGGFMDRLDCQFLMALATFIHLKTFVLGVSGPINSSPALNAALSAAVRLSPSEKDALIHFLTSK